MKYSKTSYLRKSKHHLMASAIAVAGGIATLGHSQSAHALSEAELACVIDAYTAGTPTTDCFGVDTRGGGGGGGTGGSGASGGTGGKGGGGGGGGGSNPMCTGSDFPDWFPVGPPFNVQTTQLTPTLAEVVEVFDSGNQFQHFYFMRYDGSAYNMFLDESWVHYPNPSIFKPDASSTCTWTFN